MAEARLRNQEELGKSVAEQALGICAKVAEVDALPLEDEVAQWNRCLCRQKP